jgi:diguanylate cyclase (GGDEF)-like protein/PAS domain S-box-containing protein
MRIRNLLILNATLSVGALGIIVLMTVFSFHQIRINLDQQNVISEVVSGAFELNTLVYDYTLYPTERARIQWENRFTSLHKLIGQHCDAGTSFGDNLLEICREIVSLHDTYRKLEDTQDSGLNQVPLHSVRQERLAALFLAKSQEMVASAKFLARKQDAELEQRYGDLKLLVISIGVFFLVAILTGTSWFFRSVLRPINTLRRGINEVARGNYDHKLGHYNVDEMAQVATSFNRMTDQLLESTATMSLAAKVIDNTTEAVMVTDANNIIQNVNQAFCRITGFSREEVEGKTPGMLNSGHHDKEFYQRMWQDLSTHGRWQGEIWNRRKDGRIYPEWLSINAIRDAQGNISNYVGVFSDISFQEEVQERLHNLAYYDALTGLPNRQLFSDRLQTALSRADRHGHRVDLLFLDLDRFKAINDTLGHSIGDQMLVEVARRLKETLRDEDTCARLGGDEFTVILNELPGPEAVGEVAEKISYTLRQPMHLSGHELTTTSSIGTSFYPDDGKDAESLIMKADTAMYRAKESGGDGYNLYEHEMSLVLQDRIKLERDLRKALESEQLHLVYQPQVSVDLKDWVGVEALLRWQHPDRGEIPPTVFIPMAEELGLIGEIGEWVLQEACGQYMEWQSQDINPGRMAINISAVQFRQPNLGKRILDILADSGLPPSCLEIEITESLLMEHPDMTIDILQELSSHGVYAAIDDFGTGYSSLSYLTSFNIDKLKIDKSFIQSLEKNSRSDTVASTIIALARTLGLRVIAEGVETEEQRQFLEWHRCDEIQGYLFSKPKIAGEIAFIYRELMKQDNIVVDDSRLSDKP